MSVIFDFQPSKCQCCPHIETSQLICCANQLTGFYMRVTLAFNRLNQNSAGLIVKTSAAKHFFYYLQTTKQFFEVLLFLLIMTFANYEVNVFSGSYTNQQMVKKIKRFFSASSYMKNIYSRIQLCSNNVCSNSFVPPQDVFLKDLCWQIILKNFLIISASVQKQSTRDTL